MGSHSWTEPELTPAPAHQPKSVRPSSVTRSSHYKARTNQNKRITRLLKQGMLDPSLHPPLQSAQAADSCSLSLRTRCALNGCTSGTSTTGLGSILPAPVGSSVSAVHRPAASNLASCSCSGAASLSPCPSPAAGREISLPPPRDDALETDLFSEENVLINDETECMLADCERIDSASDRSPFSIESASGAGDALVRNLRVRAAELSVWGRVPRRHL